MKIPPIILVVLTVILSVGSAGLMVFLNRKDLFEKAPVKEAKFTSIEFDADDTSYSPA